MSSSSVRLWREPVTLPTYEPFPPDKNPMFLDRRVYQGSSGKVYPLPVIDRIASEKTPRTWDAVYLENEFLRVMVLPEIGGRIHAAQDKTNGYDFIYRQDVIKPALVGLAGPWLSGGIEFNWPQHHRPTTFAPVDVHLEEHADGSKTVWLSEHDALQRMKGMHGVCLHPGRAVLELKVRAYNRTVFAQTFLWWANAAARVHDGYRSFFPPDVRYVADHAKRSMSAYPLCTGSYYGIDYAARANHGVPAPERPRQFFPPQPASAANDLSWYANIPVPTSYMCMGTREDFFGGYDYKARAGLMHVADHRIAPGKKQWTWGNHEFGYAWDRNLTDAEANGEFPPYIELMAGVFTDNQPDFSFLQPGETKTWSQFWYPFREIGPAQQANVEAALRWSIDRGVARIGVAVTRSRPGAILRVLRVAPAKLRGQEAGATGRLLHEATLDLAPNRPHTSELRVPPDLDAAQVRVTLHAADGAELLRYQPQAPDVSEAAVPPPATEPAAPKEIKTADELYLTGLHLEQYRHATRAPEAYWREALRRDSGDARSNHALGTWHLRRGEFALAESHVRAAIARLTARNPNPREGEPYYTLGVCLRFQALACPNRVQRDALENEAYDAFYKSTWNHAGQSAGFHALAEIDAARGASDRALAHLDAALRVGTENLRARDLKVMLLRRLGRADEAAVLLRATLELDPLDWWARHLNNEPLHCDTATRLDLVHDIARAGFIAEALALLVGGDAQPTPGFGPIVAYTAAWLCDQMGDTVATKTWLIRAGAASPDYCFPARLEELVILSWAVTHDVRDARAAYYLGNLLYDRRRAAEARVLWQKSVRHDPANAVAWRNLGLACFNVGGDAAAARRAYGRACRVAPRDARLCYEQDQLWKRSGISPEKRLRALETQLALVHQRDDLTVEYAMLLLRADRAREALAVVTTRSFQPWEGGEGLAREAFESAQLAVGWGAVAAGEAEIACGHFEAALLLPSSLGEARHLLASPGEIYYALGCARAASGDRTRAREAWETAANSTGDFHGMQATAFSEKTYFAALALAKLGRSAAAQKLLRGLLAAARALRRAPATIDYFATSLPTMILFEDDLAARQAIRARFLEALALLGLGHRADARRGSIAVLHADPNHYGAWAILNTLAGSPPLTKKTRRPQAPRRRAAGIE